MSSICEKFTDVAKNDIKILNDKTFKLNVEHGALICEKNNNVFLSSAKCIGTECNIDININECEQGNKIGTFHTHLPYKNPNPSPVDIKSSAESSDNIICIGSPREKYHSTKCWELNKNNDYQNLSNRYRKTESKLEKNKIAYELEEKLIISGETLFCGQSKKLPCCVIK